MSGRSSFMVPIVLALCACGNGAPPGWVTRKDPAGFTVQHPPGWILEKSSGGIVKVYRADRAALALVHPLLLRRPSSAEKWLGSRPEELNAAFPRFVVQRIQVSGPNQAMAALTYAGGTGRATVLCVLSGRNGMLYAVAAPGADYARERSTLVQVLSSFSYTGSTAAPGATPQTASRIQYAKFADPSEGAFTVEVPAGWKVQGGIARNRVAGNARPVMNLTAPDKSAQILVGDAELPMFSVPNAISARTGMREGSWYQPGVQMILSYRTGMQFASEWVSQKIGPNCQQLEWVDRSNRPDLSDLKNRTAPPQVRWSYGEVAFTCSEGGRPVRGYLLAGTLLTGGGMVQIWQVPVLQGFVAYPEKAVEVAEALSHMTRTFAMNPQWSAREMRTSMAIAEQQAKTSSEMMDMLDKSYWRREAIKDDIQRKTVNTIRSETDLVDPETGEVYKAPIGSNHYWRQPHSNTIVGTETADIPSPAIRFDRLLEW